MQYIRVLKHFGTFCSLLGVDFNSIRLRFFDGRVWLTLMSFIVSGYMWHEFSNTLVLELSFCYRFYVDFVLRNYKTWNKVPGTKYLEHSTWNKIPARNKIPGTKYQEHKTWNIGPKGPRCLWSWSWTRTWTSTLILQGSKGTGTKYLTMGPRVKSRGDLGPVGTLTSSVFGLKLLGFKVKGRGYFWLGPWVKFRRGLKPMLHFTWEV